MEVTKDVVRYEITVRRPDGVVETISKPGVVINDKLFAAMTDATRKAGRGELLSYQKISERVVVTDLVEARDILAGILVAAIGNHNAAFERGHSSSVFGKKYSDCRRAEEDAQKILDQFDAEHPEIIAAIRQERKVGADQYLLND